ncbi:MAG: hypothetical protein ACXVFK_17270 [Solirubrobacteraceae bacterium]
MSHTAAAHPRLRRRPSPPRRRSGPAPRPKTGAAAPQQRTLAHALIAAGRRLGDARVLDRLVRGRTWIGIVAVSLLGIVFMQVSLLSLNAKVSSAVTAADNLERANASYRAQISELDSGERIQTVAARLGMVMPPAGEVHFLDARHPNAALAAASITAPKPVAQTTTTSTTGTTTPASTTPAAPAAPATTATPATTAAPTTTTAPQATAAAPAVATGATAAAAIAQQAAPAAGAG